MARRKFESVKAAFDYLHSVGKLEYFGKEGLSHDTYNVCNLTLPDGRKYGVNVYENGLVVLRENLRT